MIRAPELATDPGAAPLLARAFGVSDAAEVDVVALIERMESSEARALSENLSARS